MTQLIIDGREAVLPKNFSCTVKRENSFFTKSGEYTYDCTLRLDNQVNRELYAFLERINKSDSYETNRPATLIADGHVYCRGTEIVTRWTEETVTIQIVSGESELNYFIGQDKKIEDLDMGSVTSGNQCCYPMIRTEGGGCLNVATEEYESGGATLHRKVWRAYVPQPYLCELIERIIGALGYDVTENQLRETPFRHLFIVNTINTNEFAKMLPGWTVKDFLTEAEKLTGIVFITDNLNKTCAVLLKTQYYMNATQFTINNVVDAYEAEVADEDSRQTEFTASDVSYDLPDHRWAKLMRLPEDLPRGIRTETYGSISELVEDAKTRGAQDPLIMIDSSTGRKYIRTRRDHEGERETENYTIYYLIEVDQFCKLDREGVTSELELKITPAPLAHFMGRYAGLELIDLGSTDGFFELGSAIGDDDGDDTSEPDDGFKDTFEETIRQAEKSESSAGNLYCAFYNGATTAKGFPLPYTDAYHAQLQTLIYYYERSYPVGNPEGSLRLKDLDETYFQGGYEIDTKHPITIETYDPNVINPRQVYVIRNKRFVCRDVEEVITAEGRQQKWKGNFFPIAITDEALEKRWVLTNGVWDDGGAWLDDGRWNDGH